MEDYSKLVIFFVFAFCFLNGDKGLLWELKEIMDISNCRLLSIKKNCYGYYYYYYKNLMIYVKMSFLVV